MRPIIFTAPYQDMQSKDRYTPSDHIQHTPARPFTHDPSTAKRRDVCVCSTTFEAMAAHQPSFSDLIGAAHLDSPCSSASTVSSLSMSIMPASTNAAKAAGPTYSWERRQGAVHTDEGRDCFGCGSTKGRQGSRAGPQRSHPYLQSRNVHKASSPPPVTGFEDMNLTDAELTVGSRPRTGSALEQTNCDDAELSLGPGIPVACHASSAE